MNTKTSKTRLYIWMKAERLLSLGCVATEVQIFALGQIPEEGNRWEARGIVTIKDYTEHGFSFTDEWVARDELGGTWCVRKCERDGFSFHSETGEPFFTLIEEANVAIKALVAECLSDLHSKQDSTTETILVEEPRYTGLVRKYGGQCVCDQLAASDPAAPFPWQELTAGEFPAHCFECSCGRRWWCSTPDQHQWVIVEDNAAWDMFLTYNGAVVKGIAVSKEGILQLMDTHLRENPDLVPIFGRLVTPGVDRTVDGITMRSLFAVVPE